MTVRLCLQYRYTATTTYFPPLHCRSWSEHWASPQCLPTAPLSVVHDRLHLAVRSGHNKCLCKGSLGQPTTSTTIRVPQLARYHHGRDEGFHWAHTPDGIGSTLGHQGLLVDSMSLSTSLSSGAYFRGIGFSRFSGCCMWGKLKVSTNVVRSSHLSIS